jgi:protein-S-isoprenylcysteine O-methyltransferase Ste14
VSISTLTTRFALGAVLAALVILAVTDNLFSSSPLVIGAQVFAVCLAVWARRSFPTGAFRVAATPAADSVIQRGPYRLIRHPMYAAALLFVWAAVLSHLSALTSLVGITLTGVVATRIALEERLLRERYPEYAGYVRSTKAVVPYLL